MIVKSQRKLSYRCFLGALLFLFVSLAHALAMGDAELLKKEYQQYQAWVLSRDFLFGTTLKPDRKKALAWQLIYVGMLPATYPEKEKLLVPFKQGLNSRQIFEATQLAQAMRESYGLLGSLTEAELLRIYNLHEENTSWSEMQPMMPSGLVWGKFSNWLDWLVGQNYIQNALELEQIQHELSANKKYPIVYGQIIIKGPEPFEMVQSEVKIDRHGFFIGLATNKTLSFVLPGYKSVSVAVNKNQTIQGIPPVILTMQGGNKKTGVVGRVLPWFGIEQSNMILRLAEYKNTGIKDPWYHPALPLTVTNSGQFYATGLSPGRYELFINTAGLKTSKQFTVRNGEIRGLSLIDLRKMVGR